MVTNGIPAEAGNVWFAEPGEVDLTLKEKLFIFCSMGIFTVCSIAIGVSAAFWVYGVLQ